MFLRIFFTAFFLCTVLQVPAQLKRFSFTESKMGAPFNIVLFCNDSIKASKVAKQSFNLVDSFVLIFSDYIDSSELVRLNNTAVANASPASVSPALLDILILSKKAFDKSHGTFDITMGPLTKLWRKMRREKIFPTDEVVQQKRKLTGFNKILIDTAGKKVTLTKPGMQLDLGGIAQGYIAQKVIDYLRSQNINHALVNVSGDIVMSDAPPGTKGWTVGINVPETTDELLPQNLLLHNMAVTTSGDAYQFMEHNGKRYSHIIDPRTGYGVISQRNVTVIANDGTTADWLATACSILSIKNAKKLAAKMNAVVLITENKNDKIIFYNSKGFARYFKLAAQ
ncbi:FAD:protein FMN transferase [Ferruginibacter sp.]|nr:FAD:protein FMN transferase [Ferruginibacter sp.]